MPTIYELDFPNGFKQVDNLDPKQGEGESPIYQISYPNGVVNSLDINNAVVGGVSNFLDLTDTPASYAGSADYGVKVKNSVDGLEFFSLSSLIEGIKYSWPDAAARIAQTGMVANELGIQRDTGDCYKYDGAVWNFFFNLQDGLQPLSYVFFVDVNATVSSPDGSISRPYTSLQSAIDAIPAPTSGTEEKRRYVLLVAPGHYDEDINIPAKGGQELIILGLGPVTLGAGDLANHASTVPRSLTWNTAQSTEFGECRPTLILSTLIEAETSSTHTAYAGGFTISGNLNIVNPGGGEITTKEVHLYGVKVVGAVDGTGDSGILNFYARRCFFDTTANIPTANMCVIESTEIDGLLTCSTLGRFVKCQIQGGITHGGMNSLLPPTGMFDCEISGTVTSASNLSINLATSFLSPGMALVGGGVLVIFDFWPTASQADILFRGSSQWKTLGVGAAGTVLTSQGPGLDLAWAAAGGLPAGVQGDILYHNGVAWVVLGAGVLGHVLTTQGGGANPIWAAVSALPAGVQGDILYHNGVAWVVLNAGVSGQLLQTQGGGANPLWATVTGLPAGVQGDILYHNGASWVVLGAGVLGQVLTTQGGGANPIWAAAGGLPAGVQGDILYHNGVTWVVLNAGNAGEYLMTGGVGANPSWNPIGTGGGIDFVPLDGVLPTGIVAGNLKARYDFDRSGTDLNDLSGNAVNLSLAAGTKRYETIDGIPYLMFDNTEYYTAAANPAVQIIGALTVEMLIHFNYPAGLQTIINVSNVAALTIDWLVHIQSELITAVQSSAGADNNAPAMPPVVGEPLLLTITRAVDGVTWDFYVNGDHVITVVAAAAAVVHPGSFLGIGEYNGGVGTQPFFGGINSIRIFDTQFNAAQVTESYNRVTRYVNPIPVGVQGDLLRHDGGGWVVLNIGSSGEVLQTDGIDPFWGPLGTGGEIDFVPLDGVFPTGIVAGNLQARFDHDKSASDLNDLSGNGVNLALVAGLKEYNEVKGNPYLWFEPTTQYSSTPPNPAILNIGALTFEALVFLNYLPGPQVIATVMDSVAGTCDWLVENNIDRFAILQNSPGNSVATGGPVVAGEPILLTVTRAADGVTWKFYINGELVQTGVAGAPPVAHPNAYLTFGQFAAGGSPLYAGINSTRIFSVEFTAAQVRESYDRVTRFSNPTPALNNVLLVKPASTTSYATITAALAAAVSGDYVHVGPGTYSEPPLNVPSGVSLYAPQGAERTMIAGALATGHRIILNDGSRIDGFSITLPTDGTAAINDTVTTQSWVENCHFYGAVGGVGYAVLKTGAGSTDYRDCHYISGECANVYDIQGGSAIFWSSTIRSVSGATQHGWVCTNASLGLSSCGSFAALGGDVFRSNANGIIFGGNIEIDGGAVNGVHLTADTSNVSFRGIRISNTTTWDILVDPALTTPVTHVAAGELTRTKVSIPTAALATTMLFFQDDLPGDEGFECFADFHVGVPGKGRQQHVGQGDHYTNSMFVFQNTNLEVGAWTDISAQMRSATGSTAVLFPGVGLNNTVYIGGPRPFGGVFTNTTIVVALGGGTIDWQYWNGAAWVSFDVMGTKRTSPYTSYANSVFSNVQTEHVRFDDFFSSWATKLLNGQTLYWVRAVITSAITTSPTLEQIKLHANSSKINSDGFNELFGQAIARRDITSHYLLTESYTGGGAPGNTNIAFTTNITLGTQNNTYTDNAVDGRGGIVELPEGIDTSRPIQLELLWMPAVATAGNVEWKTYQGEAKLGDTLNGTLPDNPQAIQTAVGIGNQNVLFRTTFSFYAPTLKAGDFIPLSFFRDAQAGNPNDTLVGSVIMVAFKVTGAFWQG
jgi:hypothetical protein